MSRNVCARCAKPVYFAERKTSLGRDWHPTCLRCSECGRVLSPGQHAEHKGNPYCHTPCYKALFGPSLLGYGSNLASPANFAKKDNAAEFGHDYDDDVYKREIYSNSRTSALRRQRQRRSAPPSILSHDFSALSVPATAPTGSASATESDFSSVGNSARNVPVAISSTNPVEGSGRQNHASNDAPVSAAYSGSHSVTNLRVARTAAKSEPHTVLSARGGNDAPVSGTSSPAAEVNGPRSDSEPAAKSRSSSVKVIRVDNSGSNFVGSVRVGKSSSVTNLGSTPKRSSAPVVNSVNSSSHSALHSASRAAQFGARLHMTPTLRDILEKVESFNSHYEGKVHHQMTVDQLPSGEVKVQGPLRIYWGLSRPIQLRQCDDVPAPPIAKWRHSLCVNLNNGTSHNNNTPPQKLLAQGSPSMMSPHRPMRGMDDSVLLSPASTDEVVMRRRNIRKFNTVAYRNDAPTRWKRASINGHIFNYDTSVFIPVLGSSTSVIADSTMTSPVVIETLLDKFKVENSPGEYVLSVVTEVGEQTQERLLGETDRPLLERLQLGPDDQNAKIFLKERRIEPDVTVPDTVKLPIMEEEEEEETLPAEVEQLMILPVAVLKGIMIKYEKDEEKEVKLLKAKYERCRRKIRQRLEEMRTA